MGIEKNPRLSSTLNLSFCRKENGVPEKTQSKVGAQIQYPLPYSTPFGYLGS